MTRHSGRTRKAADVVLVLLFAAVVALPGAAWLCGLAPSSALEENRQLAPLPVWRWHRGTILGFPAAFEAYFNDHFPFRGLLVKSYNLARVRCLGVSPRPEVVIGQEGWLYYRQGLLDGNAPVLPFTEEQLAHWTGQLEERRQWLAARGCRFLVVVAPDKHTIYPEYVPGWARPRARESRLDQLLEYARGHSDVAFLDLRDPLLRTKAQEKVYYKTDTHWNPRGGLAADQSVGQALARWFPQVSSYPRSALAATSSETDRGDLARLLGLASDFREGDVLCLPTVPLRAHAAAFGPISAASPDRPDQVKPVATECDDDRLPTAVVFHDSFFETIMPWLSEHFRRAVFLRQDAFDAAVVERERPDVVLQEFVERKLAYLDPDIDLPDPAAKAGVSGTR